MSPSAPEEVPQWTPAAELLVTDPAALEILWHPEKRLRLRPFLGHSADLAGAAAELGIAKPAMSYWIGRLVDAGLIRVERVEKRARHRVTFYRCVANRLRASLDGAPVASYEAVFEEFQLRWTGQATAAMTRSLARQAPSLELCVTHTGAAGVFTTILPREGHAQPADDFLYYWCRLWLTEEETETLARELNALYDRYGALSDKANKPVSSLMHLLHVREPR